MMIPLKESDNLSKELIFTSLPPFSALSFYYYLPIFHIFCVYFKQHKYAKNLPEKKFPGQDELTEEVILTQIVLEI